MDTSESCLDDTMLSTASNSFYTSGTFWAALAVFVTALVGAASVWATLRVSNPRRRLTYSIEDTRLLRPHSLGHDLTVHLDGSVLPDPRILRVELRNLGRRDIASAAFDQGLPLKVAVNVPIMESLGVEAQHTVAQPLPAVVRESEIQIGPGRIGQRSRLTYLFLVDGEPSCTWQHSLIDVKVAEAAELDNEPWAVRVIAFTAATSILALIITLMDIFR
ncbi:hypothetical protein [Streptomyces smyrnaeus]|uniref:hypothetical protein n=1 Tax=Streptomyces smyrnaeus TaxID=1387713 RepID=UPI0033EDBCF5